MRSSLLEARPSSDPGYDHGQAWGSGLSVWRTDAICVPQPYDGNTVAEIVVGIPARTFNGSVYEVINAESERPEGARPHARIVDGAGVHPPPLVRDRLSRRSFPEA